MAKKQTVNKTEAVSDYLKFHPKATRVEVAEALKADGITITPNHVGNIKSKLNKARKAKKAAKAEAPAEALPVIVETPTKANGAITLEQIKTVAQTIKTMGGVLRMTEVLEVIKETGGVKKFKELAEAISAPETDAIPF